MKSTTYMIVPLPVLQPCALIPKFQVASERSHYGLDARRKGKSTMAKTTVNAGPDMLLTPMENTKKPGEPVWNNAPMTAEISSLNEQYKAMRAKLKALCEAHVLSLHKNGAFTVPAGFELTINTPKFGSIGFAATAPRTASAGVGGLKIRK